MDTDNWKVRADGSLDFIGNYDCHKCGYLDRDFDRFYEGDDGWLYCLTHKDNR
jgi:hypothetical protein